MSEYKISQVEVEGWVTWEPETPTVSRRMLKFPDGTQVQVTGLDEIMADLYAEGKQANGKTAEEILDRLEKSNNYIPPSARREYKSVLLKEYKDYVADRKNKPPWRVFL